MAFFTVLESPDSHSDGTVFVKEGFSTSALFLTVIWALWHRMWIVAVSLFVMFAAVEALSGQLGVDGSTVSLFEVAIALLFGFEARRLEQMSLERAGYRIVGIIEASNQEAAELRYFVNKPRTDHSLPVSKFRPVLDDTLGLFSTS